MKKLLIVLVTLCVFCAGSYAQKKVVIETTSGEGVEESLKNIFMSALSTGLTNSGQYMVLANREEYVKKLSGEIAAQSAGLINDEELIDFGNAHGADQVVFVNIDAFDEQYFITVRMFDVNTGVADKTIDPILTTRSDVVKSAMEMARRMTAGGITGEVPEVSATDRYIPSLNLYIDYKDRSAKTYDQAASACQSKGEGWRLPEIDELDRIFYDQKVSPSDYGNNFARNVFWSSTKRNNFSYWTINFSTGVRTYVSSTSTYPFRCVRDKE